MKKRKPKRQKNSSKEKKPETVVRKKGHGSEEKKLMEEILDVERIVGETSRNSQGDNQLAVPMKGKQFETKTVVQEKDHGYEEKEIKEEILDVEEIVGGTSGKCQSRNQLDVPLKEKHFETRTAGQKKGYGSEEKQLMEEILNVEEIAGGTSGNSQSGIQLDMPSKEKHLDTKISLIMVALEELQQEYISHMCEEVETSEKFIHKIESLKRIIEMELNGFVVHLDVAELPNPEERHGDHQKDECLETLKLTSNKRKRCSDNFPGDRIEEIKNVSDVVESDSDNEVICQTAKKKAFVLYSESSDSSESSENSKNRSDKSP